MSFAVHQSQPGRVWTAASTAAPGGTVELDDVPELGEELPDDDDPEFDCGVLGSAGAGACTGGADAVDALPPHPSVDNSVTEAADRRMELRIEENRETVLAR